MHNPGLSSLNILGWITIKALAAWMVTVLPVALFVYGIMRVTTTRFTVRSSLTKNTHE
jgi:hypothetical protein